jgi:hypothetical protein
MTTKPYPVQLLFTSLAYGGGLMIGNIVSFFLFDQVPPNWFIYDNPVVRLAASSPASFTHWTFPLSLRSAYSSRAA